MTKDEIEWIKTISKYNNKNDKCLAKLQKLNLKWNLKI